MPQFRWDQVNFTKGELDPRVQVRTDWPNYYKGAKYVRNCICIPQGGLTKRWGTEFVDDLQMSDPTLFKYVNIDTFSYDNTTTYVLVWSNLLLLIYLENKLIFNLATIYTKEDVPNLRFTQTNKRLIIVDGNHRPMQLIRNSNNPSVMTAANNNVLTVNAFPAGTNVDSIYPVIFNVNAANFVTNPQIFTGRSYFIRTVDANQFKIYSTSEDAINNVNAYAVTRFFANGLVIIQNVWTISPIDFANVPTKDFSYQYLSSSILFTPSEVANGTAKITASATAGTVLPPNVKFFIPAHIGGVFSASGGVIRITSIDAATGLWAKGTLISKFYTDTTPITGDLCYIGEIAWSDTRGWPSCVSVFQNRLMMASTKELPNGQWLSVINKLYNFDESETNDDNAIASYPSSGSISHIKSITSARSLLIHTTSANYSTSVQNEQPLTPKMYVPIEHNKFGVGNVLPVYIDNQLLFIDSSGNNIINMCWDFIQGNYVVNIISIAASSLVRNPVDMAAFSEPNYLDGFYVLIINNDGTMCVLQTLREEDISAFSLSSTNTYLTSGQNNSCNVISSSYLKIASTQNRCWLLVSRVVIPAYVAGINNPAISTLSILVLEPGSAFFTNSEGRIPIATPENNAVYRCTFESNNAAAIIPDTLPTQIVANKFYWAKRLNIDNVAVFNSEQDALNNVNPYLFMTDGRNYSVRTYTETTKLFLEEIDFDYYTDFSITIRNNAPTTNITGLDHLNGQLVKIVSIDKTATSEKIYVLQDKIVVNGNITIERPSTMVRIGLPYQSKFVPLPVTVPERPGMLFNPTHIRTVYISYYNTAGIKIQGYGIPTQYIGEVVLGEPAVVNGGNGVFTYAPMEGWDGAIQTDLEIIQEQPLPMTITGLSYVFDT
jgi:hypothetical protein